MKKKIVKYDNGTLYVGSPTEVFREMLDDIPFGLDYLRFQIGTERFNEVKERVENERKKNKPKELKGGLRDLIGEKEYNKVKKRVENEN